MNSIENILIAKPVLKFISFVAVVLFFVVNGIAQNNSTRLSATEIVSRIEASEAISYENVVIDGDFDLSKLLTRTNDASYPEKGKIARVFSAKIVQPINFKNAVFTGKLFFFRKEETAKEIREYRIVFDKAVTFENCTFTQTADFELTNFNGGVSFANSIFKDKPSFIRMGLTTAPKFTKTVFENGSIFKNFQNDVPSDLTATELESIYQKYLDNSR